MSKQAILNMIDRLIDADFLCKNEQTKYLKTTPKWQGVYFTGGKESLPSFGKETLPMIGKETVPYNNSLDNKKDDKATPNQDFSEIIKMKKDKLYYDLKIWEKKNVDKYPGGMLDEFFKYWTEESKDGKTIRYDNEKFFNIGKRLATFKKFTKADELNEMWRIHNEKKGKKDLFT